MQFRFPVRSRKEELPGPVTSREDLYLAPAHEAVLSLTSPDNPKQPDCGTAVPDPARLTDLTSNGNRPLNLPLTITAVSGHTSEHVDEVQRASSSAGSNAEHEAAGSSCEAAPVASVLLQGAQAMLLRQQQQEEAAHAAVDAANAALLDAQACAQHQQLAFQGYLHLPELVHQGWYWTERGGDQRGPYSVAELFHMAHGSKIISVNQEIHNYIEEVSIRIRDKLNEHRGLMAAWQQTQTATTAVAQAQAALLHAHEEVQAATGQTAAAAAAVAAVVATEAKWDCNGVSQDSQGFTPSELAEEIADGRLQPLQDVIPLSHAGIPRPAGDVVQGWKAALDYAHQQAKLAGSAMHLEAEAHFPHAPPADPASAFTEQCWAYWDGQEQQGPFALQDYHSWVSSGHFVDSMTVYHISDTQTPYTLAALFSQAAPQPQPPLPPDLTPPAAATPLLGLHAGGMHTLPLPSSSSQHPQQQQQRQDLALIRWQQRQDLAPKAKAIAVQLRQQLLESGKQAVYQQLKKSVHEALPGLVETARAARAAAAAWEAAEEERRRVEAEQQAARAAEEAARLRAEAEAKAHADALEKKRLEAEALARFEREEEEARIAAEAAAAAKRRRREEAREEARRKRAEEERITQEAAARAAAEEAARVEAEAAAQQAWRDENQRLKAEAAARQLAAEQEAARQAAAQAAAERAAAEERAVKEAAARKAAAEKAAAEKAAAEAVAKEAAERQAQEERAAAEQVRLLAAKMAAKRLAAEQLAEEEGRAQAEKEAQRKAELKARRVAVAQAMQEKKVAKAAAKREQLEKAKVARAASMAAKAAARAAEAEAAAAASPCGHLSSDDDFLGPLQGRSQQPCQATQQSRHSSHGAAGPCRSLNGAAQHAQHGQAGSVPADREGVKQPVSRNGYHSNHAQHAQHSQRISHDSQAVLAESGAQDSEPNFRFPVESEHRGTPHLFHDQHLKEEDAWDGAHVQYMHSRGVTQLPSELQASASESRQPESEEAEREADRGGDEEFDWGAWMSPEGERKAIAERLQRPRRPPKRPYPLPDPPKPKPKKPQQSLRGSSSQHRDARLQHRPPDRLLIPSSAPGQFSHEDWSHALGPLQQPPRDRPGSAPPGRTAAAASQGATKGRSKGRSKGRRALEEVGCIRAAAYQGEAFMQARMDVLQQQGVLPGNQAPADAHPDHQAMPHTVRVVGGKQRGHRSAVRDLSRDEAVTDASKWGLLKGRTQDLRFGRSRVHAWGLFAKQDIEPEEFIVEYVGQTIRTSLLDVREKAYERSGLGSSYLFRIDESWAVDATRQGGLARFVNHSCDPNCYTKIITVDGHKHIVIYSKHHIHAGEELSYDYKFEYELMEEPIKCTCGAINCRGRLN